jgi:putative transposase
MMLQSNNCVHLLNFHLIFVVKYRKKLLIRYGEKVKSLLLESAKQSKKFHIEKLEVDQDHVHMLIQMHPTETISNIVKRLKSYTTYHLWQFDEENLTNQFWKEKMFWSKSYFVRSVGEVDIDVVKKYIDEQGKTKILNSRKIHRVMLKH